MKGKKEYSLKRKLLSLVCLMLLVCIYGCGTDTTGKENTSENQPQGEDGFNEEGKTSEQVVSTEQNVTTKQLETTEYLFATFKNDNGARGQQIWFSVSEDGNFWTDLNDDKAVLSVSNATQGDKGVRDPFLIRSPEGNHFYLIATDLCIGTGEGTHSWDTAQNSKTCSNYIRIWETDDLVHFSEPWLAEIGVEGSCFTWAPEAIWDEESQQYMVYWSAGGTLDPNNKYSTYQNRTWYCMTKDFHTFSEPKLFTSSVNGNGMIDMSIISVGDGTYYRISSSTPDIMIEKSTTGLFGEWSIVSSLQNLGFSYGAAGNETPGITIVEGPEFFKYNKDDSLLDIDGNILSTWGVLVDNYGGLGYFPLVTTDLGCTIPYGTEGSTWTKPEYDFCSRKRHGTILPITRTEYEAILAAYGNSESVTELSQQKEQEEEAKEPVLLYDFESVTNTTVNDTGTGNSTAENGTLMGFASVSYDSERESNVLTLNGVNKTYLEFPKGFFDGRDVMTISMDVKSNLASGNFFTFTYGKNSTIYDFLRIRGTSIRNAITKESWSAEYEVAYSSGAATGVWQNITLVIDGKQHSLYVDGNLQSTARVGHTTTQLGTDLIAYLGKSFYDGDIYFKGSFDNVKIYNRALTQDEIWEELDMEKQLVLGATVEGDELTVASVDVEAKKVLLTFANSRFTQKDTEGVKLNRVKLSLRLCEGASWENNGMEIDLSTPITISVICGEVTEQWTIEAGISTNPVLVGQFADPDIDCFDGTYYIYPTTDGYPGWSGTQFHCFSSKDLVNWVDEGIILDVKNNAVLGEDNANGIPGVPWSIGSAWAPTIEEKNGRYYFYFCAKLPDGNSCIGLATAENPTGPFKAMEEPFLTQETVTKNIHVSGQTIDPSVFTDEDGTSYLLFGNCYGAIVQLTEDMTGWVEGTMHHITETKDLRESIIVFKKDGLYHFTWSCDDTGSENYHVNYGYSDSLYGNITYVGTVLQKDATHGILGTGHQSVLYDQASGNYYMAYHRFVTPAGTYQSDFGVHRETCIGLITFDEKGLIKSVVTE